MKTIPIGSSFVDSFIIYKCVEDDAFHGCMACAFCVASDVGRGCVAPPYVRCSPGLRVDEKSVRFEEVGELFSINGKEV